MANLLTMGINFAFDTADVVRGSRTVRRSMTDLERNFQRNRKELDKLNKQFNSVSDQGISNIQAGLVQLSTYLLNANVALDNFFEKTLNQLKNIEQAKAGLEVTLGLPTATGEDLERLRKEFGQFNEIIEDTALKTKFTEAEITKAFQALVQSGYKADEAIRALQPTLDFTAASQGVLNLEQGIQAVTLAVTSMGSSIEDSSMNMDMLLRASQRTKLAIEGMVPMMESMSSAQLSFGDIDDLDLPKGAELLVLASALRGVGKSHREAGHGVVGFARSIMKMFNAVNKEIFRGDKAFKRVNEKRSALIQLMLDNHQRLFSKNMDVQKIYNEEVKKLFQDEEGNIKSSVQLLNMFTIRFRKLIDEVGGAQAEAILTKAIGGEEGLNMIRAAIQLQDKMAKDGIHRNKALLDLAKDFADVQGDSAKAAAKDLTTLGGKMKLLESATDALTKALGEQDIASKGLLDVQIGLTQTTAQVLNENKTLSKGIMGLGRVFQIVTDLGYKFGFMLVAAATFSIGIKHAMRQTKIATKGLGSTMRSFGAIFLKPTLLVVFQFTKAIAGASLALAGLIHYFGEGKTVGESFSNVISSLRSKFEDFLPMLKMLFGSDENIKKLGGANSIAESYEKAKEAIEEVNRIQSLMFKAAQNNDSVVFEHMSKAFRKAGKEVAIYREMLGKDVVNRLADPEQAEGLLAMARITDTLRNSFKNLVVFLDGALIPITKAVGFTFETLSISLKFLFSPLIAIAKLFGLISDNTGGAGSAVFKFLGILVGSFAGLGLVIKTLSFSFTLISSKFLSLKTSLQNFTSRMNATKQGFTKLEQKYNVQIGFIDRLKLEYLQATGQVEKFNSAIHRLDSRLAGTAQRLDILRGKGQRTTSTLSHAFTILGSKFPRITAGLSTMRNGMRTLAGTARSLGAALGRAFGPIMAVLGVLYTLAEVSGASAQTLEHLSTALSLAAAGYSLYAIGAWSAIPPTIIFLGKILLIVAAIGAIVYAVAALGRAMGAGWATSLANSMESATKSLFSSKNKIPVEAGITATTFGSEFKTNATPETPFKVNSISSSPIASAGTVQNNNKITITQNFNGPADAKVVSAAASEGVTKAVRQGRIIVSPEAAELGSARL